eukprot:3746006-Alexandrium_andersonii.AAC.1
MATMEEAGERGGGASWLIQGGGAPQEGAMRAAIHNPLIRNPAIHNVADNSRLVCVGPVLRPMIHK